jgi:hypothetical protein
MHLIFIYKYFLSGSSALNHRSKVLVRISLFFGTQRISNVRVPPVTRTETHTYPSWKATK